MLIEREIKNKFIPEIIIDHLQQNGIDFITSLPEDHFVTINDVIEHCKNIGLRCGRDNIDFGKIIKEAVSTGYDERYTETPETDERSIDSSQFLSSFWDVLEELGMLATYKNKKVIVVGIGNGHEGKILYSDVRNLVIVDVAPKSLKRAQTILPHSEVYQTESSKLEAFADNSFDLYISLRTYQSTYFDISASLQEAKRVLKSNGAIVISIASGYLDKNGELAYGLFNPHRGVLEKDRPDLFLKIIQQHLTILDFIIVGTKKMPSEIFIYAVKH